jgi:hypothetical protein
VSRPRPSERWSPPAAWRAFISSRARRRPPEQLFRGSSTRRRVLGPSTRIPDVDEQLGEVYEQEGRLDEARKVFIETRDIRTRVLGPNHPDTAFSVYNLGLLAARRGERDEAFRLVNDALDRGLSAEHGNHLGDAPELQPFRDDPRFAALVARSESQSTAGKK